MTGSEAQPTPPGEFAHEPATAGPCPFLVATSGQWRLAAPSREHRCTAFSPPADLAPEKQARLCLTVSHPGCATYLASRAARSARLAGHDALASRWRLTRTTTLIEDAGGVGGALVGLVLDRRRWPAIPAVLLVATLLTLAISGFRAGIPATAVDSETPVPTGLPSPTVGASPSALSVPPPTAEPTATPAPASPSAAASRAPTATPAASFLTYRVRSGDTLSVIATRFDTTVRAIADLNGITDPSRLRVGQVLLIP